MEKQVRVGIIGAVGYVGKEIVRLLLGHPYMQITRLATRSDAGRLFSDVYPGFLGLCDVLLEDPEKVTWESDCDVVITALPHGVSQQYVIRMLERGLKVLDHSGDFRFKNAADYENSYKLKAAPDAWLQEAVYGLPEFYRQDLRRTRLISNPGCYPTASLIAFAPLLASSAIDCEKIIIHAMSGLSGAGRKGTVDFSYCEAAESAKPYGVIGHRHAAEIKQEMDRLAGQPVKLSFTPHLLPIKRGMLVSGLAFAKKSWDNGALNELYKNYYEDDVFVRVLKPGQLPETSHSTRSNFVDVTALFDHESGCIKVFSALDNLGKGAAGQAVQSLNIMFGLPEQQGLLVPGI